MEIAFPAGDDGLYYIEKTDVRKYNTGDQYVHNGETYIITSVEHDLRKKESSDTSKYKYGQRFKNKEVITRIDEYTAVYGNPKIPGMLHVKYDRGKIYIKKAAASPVALAPAAAAANFSNPAVAPLVHGDADKDVPFKHKSVTHGLETIQEGDKSNSE